MNMNRRMASSQLIVAALIATTPPLVALAQDFDHQHEAWTSLLRRHVVLISSGHASQLKYSGMATDRKQLKAYLSSLSAVTPTSFDTFSKAQQKAFLINAYNAFTVELILTRYPNLKSIKELGSLISSPWKKDFISLLGTTMSLDHIEQDMLRKRGRYDDPRIHFAVNCASIGCPMLREEAYVAERLDAQLAQQAERFLSDQSRNRFNSETGRLEVSKIFDWYGNDFNLGHQGIRSVKAFLARYADQLTSRASDREAIRAERAAVEFLEYDWRLNDTSAR